MERLNRLFPSTENDLKPVVTNKQDQMIHVLCGLYCVVAVFMLVFFGAEALLVGNINYGTTLIGFALTTCGGYGYLWRSGHLQYASHLVTLLMGLLCLYLFYSGGADNTGVLWYFIYPSLVIFIQGVRAGIISVVLVLVFTLLLYWFALFGFDTARYSNAFMQRFVAVYMTVTVLTCLFAVFRDLAEEKLEEINRKLAIISTTDPMTGLVNRRRMHELLVEETRRFARQEIPFSIIMLDIDYFKKVNDNYGHQFGDDVIKTTGEVCRKALRSIDTVCRWGGEEYLVLLPGSSLADARPVAERLRKGVNAFRFNYQDKSVQVSISLGLAQYRQGITLEECIRHADQCLYRAKETGRNRTVDERQLVSPGDR